jgi:hypothetical protein
MSAAGRVDHASNALQTDALACLEALHAASDLVVTDIEVESDALVPVQALNGDEYDRAANGLLFKEIKPAIQLCFLVDESLVPVQKRI